MASGVARREVGAAQDVANIRKSSSDACELRAAQAFADRPNIGAVSFAAIVHAYVTVGKQARLPPLQPDASRAKRPLPPEDVQKSWFPLPPHGNQADPRLRAPPTLMMSAK